MCDTVWPPLWKILATPLFYSFAESFAVYILFPSVLPDTKIKPHKKLYLIYVFIQEKSKPSLTFNPVFSTDHLSKNRALVNNSWATPNKLENVLVYSGDRF